VRILTLDIETSPNEAYTFGMWNVNIGHKMLMEPTYMLSFAAKFLGEKEMFFKTCYDEDMHDVLYDLLADADAVVTYNGDKFDMKHINREFIERGYGPPRPLASIDLIKTVRGRFNFPSNRLDYVCSVLLGENKLETGGFDLWPAFMKGDEKAIKTMRRYNIKDVRLTERLYKYLIPWIKNHPHVGRIATEIDDADTVYQCPSCGSPYTTKARPRRTKCYAVRVVNCNSCGSWFDGKRTKL
jgi:DNA polymerase elongation subunit (family B)/DNA-directed RNA polymerase subunit RPC12/RpoP